MRGNGPLEGEVKVQGSKNAALPMMAAAVLHEGRTVLHNCPRIADVFEMEAILRSMGVKTAWSGHTLELDCNKICETGIPGEETRTMRSSILLLGSMLGRCKQIRIGYPGGCTIGARPVDLHLDAMKKMGVLIRETEGEICGECPEGLSGAHIHFPISSVGATENALLAGVTARGETLLENCALEPEIMHLCHFLQAMGAEIRGIFIGIAAEENDLQRWVRGQHLIDECNAVKLRHTDVTNDDIRVRIVDEHHGLQPVCRFTHDAHVHHFPVYGSAYALARHLGIVHNDHLVH